MFERFVFYVVYFHIINAHIHNYLIANPARRGS